MLSITQVLGWGILIYPHAGADPAAGDGRPWLVAGVRHGRDFRCASWCRRCWRRPSAG
ncbi:MAG: hypothetical protein MZV49_11580 [Rhodopseudomonas palustris]|nr:hypothetical protein [Rhodopseudomonas palustris]